MAQQATPNTKHAGKRLLIADDDTDMRLLLAEYFRRLGFTVEERESGMAALVGGLLTTAFPPLPSCRGRAVET